MLWVNYIGSLAALSVLASFCMTTMIPLRILALTSNVLFSLYGLVGHIYPVLVLHVILMPINLIKLVELRSHARAAKVDEHQTGSATSTIAPDELRSRFGLRQV